MFEIIKSELMPVHTVAVPHNVAKLFINVCTHNNIRESGIIIENHNEKPNNHTEHIKKKWAEKLKLIYPYEIPTAGFTCIETNIPDDYIGKLVRHCVLNANQDPELIYTRQKTLDETIAKFNTYEKCETYRKSLKYGIDYVMRYPHCDGIELRNSYIDDMVGNGYNHITVHIADMISAKGYPAYKHTYRFFINCWKNNKITEFMVKDTVDEAFEEYLKFINDSTIRGILNNPNHNLIESIEIMNNSSHTKSYFDAKLAVDETVKWLRDWFDHNGKDCKAVIGISGGKDSSVVAALCVKALGRDRVFGVLMPNGEQADIDVARNLCKELDIENITVDISSACRALKHAIKPELGDHWSAQTSTNLPARVRMTTLYAVSQTIGGRVINTCNYSEDYVGYSTRYGDSAGDVSPLGKFTVAEVKAIGHELGLSNCFVDKTPSDGLCGKSDEDNLGFTYETLDNYIRNHIDPPVDIKAKIDELHVKNEFKLEPIPTFDYFDMIKSAAYRN